MKKETVKEEIWSEAIENGAILNYRALGNSMSPFIHDGSILQIKQSDRLFLGDIILYSSERGLISHRVIERRKESGEIIFVTKGDGSPTRDEPVKSDQIIGKVIKVGRDNRTMMMESAQWRMINYMIAILSPMVLPRIFKVLRKIKTMVSLHET